MASILALYDKYRIMPQLQLHQLRVAAVGKLICDHATQAIDTATVVEALLVHDMGNLLKIALSDSDYVRPLGLGYWAAVKRCYCDTYGPDETRATRRIADEIGLSSKARDYLGCIGFSRAAELVRDPSLEKKVCCYADMRVAPGGVVGFKERLAEATARYAERDAIPSTLLVDVATLQRQIFRSLSLSPHDITDASIAPLVKLLRSTEVGRNP